MKSTYKLSSAEVLGTLAIVTILIALWIIALKQGWIE